MCEATKRADEAGEAARLDLEGAVKVGEALAFMQSACEDVEAATRLLGEVRGFHVEATAALDSMRGVIAVASAVKERRSELAAE